jgi:hypothetical protein
MYQDSGSRATVRNGGGASASTAPARPENRVGTPRREESGGWKRPVHARTRVRRHLRTRHRSAHRRRRQPIDPPRRTHSVGEKALELLGRHDHPSIAVAFEAGKELAEAERSRAGGGRRAGVRAGMNTPKPSTNAELSTAGIVVVVAALDQAVVHAAAKAAEERVERALELRQGDGITRPHARPHARCGALGSALRRPPDEPASSQVARVENAAS